MNGSQLKKIIESLRISQRRFARIAGVAPNTVTNATKNNPERKVSLNLMKWARLLSDRPELMDLVESYEE